MAEGREHTKEGGDIAAVETAGNAAIRLEARRMLESAIARRKDTFRDDPVREFNAEPRICVNIQSGNARPVISIKLGRDESLEAAADLLNKLEADLKESGNIEITIDSVDFMLIRNVAMGSDDVSEKVPPHLNFLEQRKNPWLFFRLNIHAPDGKLWHEGQTRFEAAMQTAGRLRSLVSHQTPIYLYWRDLNSILIGPNDEIEMRIEEVRNYMRARFEEWDP